MRKIINRSCIPVFFALSALLLVTACSNLPDDTSQPQSSKSVSSGIPSTYKFVNPPKIQKKVNDMITVDAPVQVPQAFLTGTADIVNAKIMIPNPKSIRNAFIKNEKIKQADPRSHSEEIDCFGTKVLSFCVVTEKNAVVSSQDGLSIQYVRPFGETLNCLAPDDGTLVNANQSLNESNKTVFSQTSDLPFESRKQAAEKIKAKLAEVGVFIAPEYTCYSLDHNNLKKAEDAYKKEISSLSSEEKAEYKSVDNWTAAHDSYYFLFTLAFNNAPSTPIDHGDFSSGKIVMGSQIKVIYSKDGIIMLQTNIIYSKESVKQANQKLLTAEDALNKVPNAYKDIITSSKIKITGIHLEYVATLIGKSRMEFVMVPAWRFDMEQQSNQTGDAVAVRKLFINAVTGEMIK